MDKKEFTKILQESLFEDEEDNSVINEIIQNNPEIKGYLENILEDLISENSEGLESHLSFVLENIIQELGDEVHSEILRSKFKGAFKKKVTTLKSLLHAYEKKSLSPGEEIVLKSIYKKIDKNKKLYKKTLERFIIYEMHKIINPRRIAGETKVDNFINNVILRGLKSARKYDGGKNKDLKKYSQGAVVSLQMRHENLKKNAKKFSRGL